MIKDDLESLKDKSFVCLGGGGCGKTTMLADLNLETIHWFYVSLTKLVTISDEEKLKMSLLSVLLS